MKSLYCHACSKYENKLTEEQFNEWYENHKDDCQINHQGSSDLMETEGAIETFLRSISKYNLRYTTFVGDRDSSCYGAVAEDSKDRFGDEHSVIKEECMGHVQKRMWTRLRTYKKNMRGSKLDDGKDVNGGGRLTNKCIDKMQIFY